MNDKFSLPPHLNVTPYPHHPEIFVAEGARLIGDLRLSKGVSIWFNAVLRGDVNYIEIGEYSNIQDGSIIHVTNQNPCVVGEKVTVGHHVNLHGCQVEEKSLIGIGAILLTGCKIGRGSVIAAGALIKENQEVPPFSLMAGIPAKRIRSLSENMLSEHEQWANKYYQLSKSYSP